MEVCGTHTMAIARYGLRQLLPDGMRLVSRPGLPGVRHRHRPTSTASWRWRGCPR